ncbi:MAG: hypothetical protein WD049_05080 [Candidatus Paceibacterota bacterium]
MTYRNRKRKNPTLVRWMLKVPFIKNESQANLGLVVIMVAALLASYLILNDAFNLTGSNNPTYVEDLTPEERAGLPPELLEVLPSRSGQ